MSDDVRRFDEHEVGLILKRVAELHEREASRSARSLTRGEIEEVVAELGLPKALVARAAAELSIRDVRNQPVWWLGGKTDVLLEETVNGEIDEATFDRMLDVVRRYFGDAGELTTQGNARIWSASRRTSRRVQFTVFAVDGTSTLRLEERMPDDARATVGAGTAAGALGGVMTAIPLKALVVKAVLMMALPGIIGGGALAGWMFGRTVWKRRARRRESELRAALGELIALPRSSTPM